MASRRQQTGTITPNTTRNLSRVMSREKLQNIFVGTTYLTDVAAAPRRPAKGGELRSLLKGEMGEGGVGDGL